MLRFVEFHSAIDVLHPVAQHPIHQSRQLWRPLL